MRIDGVNKMTKAYTAAQNNTSPVKKAMKTDEFKISTTASECQQAYQLASKVPAVRQEKIDAIKEGIRTGTYQVDAKEVSEKILSQIDLNI